MSGRGNEAGIVKGTPGIMRPIPDDFAETAARISGVKALCRHYKCRSLTIYRWASEAGVELPSRQALPVPDDIAQHAKKMTAVELARHYKCSAPTVYRWLLLAGVKPARSVRAAAKPKPPVSKVRPVPADFAEKAKTMHKAELRRHYSTSFDALNRWLRETGITPASAPRPVPPRPKTHSLIPTASFGRHIATTKTYTAHDIAARTLGRFGPVYRCTREGVADRTGDHWCLGRIVVDGDGLLARAARAERKAA